MLELVEEADVVVRLDHERRDLDQRQHAVDDAGQGGLLDALLAGGLADDLPAVEQHPLPGVEACLEPAHELSLRGFELGEPRRAVKGPAEHRGELGALALPLHLGHHPAGGVAVAVAARSIQATGPQRVPDQEPQRDLVACADRASLIVKRPRPPGGWQHLERRGGEQPQVAVGVRVLDCREESFVAAAGGQVQRGDHPGRELREVAVAAMQRVAAFLLDRHRQRARVRDGLTQTLLADFAQGAADRVFAVVDRVQQDPGERAGQAASLISGAGGCLALLLDRVAGGSLGVLERRAVPVDQLIPALAKHLGDEHQQQRVTPRRRQSRDLPRGAAPRVRGEDPHPPGRQHRQIHSLSPERPEVLELRELSHDRRGRAVRRRRPDPLEPRHPARLPQIEQPVKLPGTARAAELGGERLGRRGVRGLPGGADQPDEHVDRGAHDAARAQLLARQGVQRLRTLVLHRAMHEPLLQPRSLGSVERLEAGAVADGQEVIGARLIAGAVEREIIGVGLELLTERQKRGLRQLGEILGDEPEPAQRAQLDRDTEPGLAAVGARKPQVIGRELEEGAHVLRPRPRWECPELAPLRR